MGKRLRYGRSVIKKKKNEKKKIFVFLRDERLPAIKRRTMAMTRRVWMPRSGKGIRTA
jgi:hypothetical protein